MSKQVMIVDDEKDVLFALKVILSSAGFTVTTASSGKECLACLKKGFRGLVLIDVTMPDMDGWQTVEAIVKSGHKENTVLCMLTALHTPDPAMEKVTEYIIDYIRKPVSADALIAAAVSYLSLLDDRETK